VKIITVLAVFLLLLAAACTSQKPSPGEVREKTAQATADIKQDAQALAQGVREGWNRDKPLDLNQAGKDQLLSLPGMSAEAADRIIANRPYSNSHELVTRKLISQQEYEKIKDQVITTH
jgi:competence protein ComEA